MKLFKFRKRRKPWWLRLEQWLYKDAWLLPYVSIGMLVGSNRPHWLLAIPALYLIFLMFYHYRTRSSCWAWWSFRNTDKTETPVTFILSHIPWVLIIVFFCFFGTKDLTDFIFR